MNIYKHEFKVNFKIMVAWIVTLCGLAAMLMAFYPMLKNDLDTFLKMLDNFPPVIKAAMGIAVDSFKSPLGYYTFAFTYSMLFAAIQAMNLGIGIVSKEEREKTADFILTKPASRTRILTAKLLSVLTVFIITNLFYTFVSWLLVLGLSDNGLEMNKFILINASLFFLQMIFFSISLIISVSAKKIKAVLPVSLGLVFGFFAISAFAVTSEDDKLRFLTPFQYFKTEYVIIHGSYEKIYPVIGAAIVIICIAASYLLFKRRDIHSV